MEEQVGLDMAELANCYNCNAVFVKTARNICPKCFAEEEKAFEVVYQFIRKRENREATIPEIVEATGVEEKLIIKFVKDKRLRTTMFPNLSYPCEKCGTKIVTGRLCQKCSEKIIKDVYLHELEEKAMEKERERINTYYTLDRDRK